MSPEHKVMVYQSLLQETEDAAVALVVDLAGSQADLILRRLEEFLTDAGDRIDPRAKILRRTVQALRRKSDKTA